MPTTEVSAHSAGYEGVPRVWPFNATDKLDPDVSELLSMHCSWRVLDCDEAQLWDHGQPVNLGTLQPNSNAAALDVNIWGVIVGSSYSFDTNLDLPVVWSKGSVQQLPLLPGETQGSAEEINVLGVIVGAQWSDTNQVPCLWYSNGSGYTAVNLGSIGGNFGQAFGINNVNQAVGYSFYPGDIHSPGFFWDYRHGLQALPLLPPDTDATILNINDFGQIVGLSQVFDDNGNFVSQRAAIWGNGTVIDLQTLVPPGTPPLNYQVGNINDLGEITVDATNPDGTSLGLLLVPTNKH